MQIGKWSNARYPSLKNGGYIEGEKTYQMLSIVAKSLLVWLVTFGGM